jgi:pimeloyl-ACP methyl ester carboxylesterase
MGTPIAITQNYINPYWHQYNEGLVKITSPDRSKGPVQAENCGHFIQRDDPPFVIREVVELLHKQGVPTALQEKAQ